MSNLYNIAIGANTVLPAGQSYQLNIGNWIYGSGTALNNVNIGIGTNNPQAKLDVEGDIRIADGTEGSGKYLVSNDNGKGFWSYTPPPPCKPGGQP